MANVDFNWHAVHGGPVRLSDNEEALLLSNWRAKVPDPPTPEIVLEQVDDEESVFIVFGIQIGILVSGPSGGHGRPKAGSNLAIVLSSYSVGRGEG